MWVPGVESAGLFSCQMSSPGLKKTTSWDNYRYGRSRREESTDSVPTQAQFDGPSPGETTGLLNPRRPSDGNGNGNGNGDENNNGDESVQRRRYEIPLSPLGSWRNMLQIYPLKLQY